MRRATRCITLDPEADAILRRLVQRAKKEWAAASALNLVDRERRVRPLSARERRRVGRLAGCPNVRTDAHLMRAIDRIAAADPAAAAEAALALDDIYTRVPCINASRVIEVLIVEGARRVESLGEAEISAGGHAGEAGDQPVDGQACEVAANTSVHGRRDEAFAA